MNTLLLGGCIMQPPLWRAETKLLLDRAQLNEAAQMVPEEYASVVTALNAADSMFQRGLVDEAELEYKQALTKARMLENRLYAEQLKRSTEAQARVEADLLKVERQRAIFEDQRRLHWEEQQNQVVKSETVQIEAEPKPEKPIRKEPAPAVNYTVKRGESLPQIASRPEVYGDSQLWPLLYRSNRDQISDPRRIWPGQVLKIPRTMSADEVAEARRYAQRNAYF
jgi:LysM domain